MRGARQDRDRRAEGVVGRRLFGRRLDDEDGREHRDPCATGPVHQAAKGSKAKQGRRHNTSFNGPSKADPKSKEQIFLEGLLKQMSHAYERMVTLADTQRENGLVMRSLAERQQGDAHTDLNSLTDIYLKQLKSSEEMLKMVTTAWLNAAALPYTLAPGGTWDQTVWAQLRLFSFRQPWGTF